MERKKGLCQTIPETVFDAALSNKGYLKNDCDCFDCRLRIYPRFLPAADDLIGSAMCLIKRSKPQKMMLKA